MNGRPRPTIEKQHGAVALVDGDQGPGQVAGVFATDLSIDLAREHGAGVVAVHRSSHYGAAGYYAIRAAEAGMVGMSTTNSEPFVVPYGGIGHALGTTRSRSRRRRPTASSTPTWPPARSRSTRSSTRATRAHDPRGLGRRRAGPPDHRPARSSPPCPSAATRATRSRSSSSSSPACVGLRVGHGIGRLYEATSRRRALPPRHRHRRLAGRERAAAAARPASSATSRRSRPLPATTRCSCPASRSSAPRPSANATASRCRRRCGRRSPSSVRNLA